MTKDDIMRMAREAGLFVHKEVQPEFIAFANLVAAAEREACAKVAFDGYDHRLDGDEIGAAIRARGTT
jgi:hypothetical protein